MYEFVGGLCPFVVDEKSLQRNGFYDVRLLRNHYLKVFP